MKLLILLSIIGLIWAETHIEVVEKELPKAEAKQAPSIPDNLLNLGDNVANKMKNILPKMPPLEPFAGGPSDPDNPNASLFEDASSEENPDEKSEETNSDEVNSDESDTNSNLILTWFKLKRPDSFDNMPERPIIPQNQMMPTTDDDLIRKCMMHAIMRYRTSVFIRAIIHFLFISGFVLISIFISLIILRTIKKKRQNALNNIFISDDDAEDYKYKRLNNESTDKEDSKSLPDYSETLKSEIKN